MKLDVRVEGLGAGREEQRMARLDVRLKALVRARQVAVGRGRARLGGARLGGGGLGGGGLHGAPAAGDETDAGI